MFAQKPPWLIAYGETGNFLKWRLPASNYNEWRTINGVKQPFYFSAADGGVLSIIGLWDTWTNRSSRAGPLLSCMLIVSMAVEKGTPGKRAFAEAFAACGQ